MTAPLDTEGFFEGVFFSYLFEIKIEYHNLPLPFLPYKFFHVPLLVIFQMLGLFFSLIIAHAYMYIQIFS